MCIPSNGEIVPADHACPGEIVILADDTLKLNDILGNEKLLPHTRSIDNLYLILTAKIAIAAGLYIIIMQLSKSATFKEVINYLSKKK